MKGMVVYTNRKRKKDTFIFEWDLGQLYTEVKHEPESFGQYLGTDGSKVEVCWSYPLEMPALYHGWSS